MDELVNLNENPKFREYMTAEEDARKIYNSEMYEARQTGMQEGLKNGLKQGKEQGLEQATKEIVEKMLKEKMKEEEISKFTGLSLEEINKIKIINE